MKNGWMDIFLISLKPIFFLVAGACIFNILKSGSVNICHSFALGGNMRDFHRSLHEALPPSPPTIKIPANFCMHSAHLIQSDLQDEKRQKLPPKSSCP